MRALGKFTRVTLGHSGEDEFYAQVAKTAERGSRQLDSPVEFAGNAEARRCCGSWE